jgi:CDP-diacylglycerol---serine O-phosphatidyltransferase
LAKSRRFKWKKEPVSVVKLIPNIITLMGLAAGLSSIRYAFDEKWEYAVLCTILAAVIDGIDGRIARLLNASSTFGAELDSLSDFVNFGIAPPVILYFWISEDYKIKMISWGVVMLFAVCSAIRLARFNTFAINQNDEKKLENYFIGVPAPMGGILALLPLMNEFDIKYITGFSFQTHSLTISMYHIFIGLLMASTIPTFSLKKTKIHPKYFSVILISFSAFSFLLFLYSWYIIPIVCIIYIISIVFSYKYAMKELEQNRVLDAKPNN